MAIDVGGGLGGSDVTGMRVVIDPSAAQKGADVVNRSFDSMPDHANRAFSKIDSSIGRLRRSLFGLQTAFTGIGIGVLASEVLRADVTMAKIIGTLRTATGSGAMAAVTFREVKEISRSLAIDLGTAANAFARLQAATRGTNTEGKATFDLFKGVSAAVTATGGGAYELYLALKAVEQMASKGRIQMEELRGQLGDVLPGAFNLTAEAIGVTTGQLNRMMKVGLSADDVLPKLGPHLLKVFEEPAKQMGETIIGTLNKWKTFKLELLSTVGLSGFASALNKTVLQLEKLLEQPEFIKAAKNFGELMGVAVTKVTDAMVYLGNHIEYVKAAFLAFGSIKLIEFFQSLAAAINTVRDSLIALKIAEASSGLLKPGGGAAVVSAAEGMAVGPKGGLASLALMYPYLFGENGSPLSSSQMNARVASPSFNRPTVNPQVGLQMLSMFTGKKGQTLNQSQFNARLSSSDFFQNMGFLERDQFRAMAKQFNLKVPLSSVFAGLIPTSFRNFFSGEEGKGINLSGIAQQGSYKDLFNEVGKGLTPQHVADLTLLRGKLRDEVVKDVEKLYVGINKDAAMEANESFTEVGGRQGIKWGMYLGKQAPPGTAIHEFGHILDAQYNTGEMYGPSGLGNPIIQAAQKNLKKELDRQYNSMTYEERRFANENPQMSVREMPKSLRRKILTNYALMGSWSESGMDEYIPEVFDQTIRNPRRTKKIAPVGFAYSSMFLQSGGINPFDSKTLDQFSFFLDKNGKLLNDGAIKAKLLGKSFNDLGISQRYVIKQFGDLIGVNVSWGKVVGGLIPTTKTFVDTLTSKQTRSNALTGISNFSAKTAESFKNLPATLNDLTRNGFVKMTTSSQGLFLALNNLSTKGFGLLKTTGSGAWNVLKSGAGLAIRSFETIGFKIAGVVESLAGLVAANPFLAIAAAAAATYIVYDTIKDKLVTIDGHTITVKEHLEGWREVLQGALGDVEDLAKKLADIKLPQAKRSVGENTGYFLGMLGTLGANLATGGTFTNPFGIKAGPYVQGGLKGLAAGLGEIQHNVNKAGESQGYVNPITGEYVPFPLQVPDFALNYPKQPSKLKTNPITYSMDEIQRAVAGLKEDIKGSDAVFKKMTETGDILAKSSLPIVVLEAEKTAKKTLAEYNKSASEATSSMSTGTKKAIYSPDKGLGKQFIDLSKLKAYKDGLIQATSQLGELNAQIEDQNKIQEAVNAAMEHGEYAVERARAAKEHDIQIQKLLNGLDAESVRALQPYIDKLKEAKDRQIDLSVQEKIRADAMRANLNLPWKQLEITFAQLKEQQSEGLSPAAYWLESTRAIEQYKQQLDEVVMSTKKFSAGAFVAFREYADAAKNAAQSAYQIFSDTIHGLEDALVQLTRFKGFQGFKNLGNQILDDYQRAVVRKYITGPLSDYFAKKFGLDLGLVKADGSKDAPFYVKNVDALISGDSSTSPQIGGWIGWIQKILGFGSKNSYANYNKMNQGILGPILNSVMAPPTLISGPSEEIPGISGIPFTPSWDDPSLINILGNGVNIGAIKTAGDIMLDTANTQSGIVATQDKGWQKILSDVGGGFKNIFSTLGGWVEKFLKMFMGGGRYPWDEKIGGGGGGGFLSSILGGIIPGIGGLFSGVTNGGITDGVVTSGFPGFALAGGGVMTSSGLLKLNRYSAGGVATNPQLALYGEGRRPEAYVPLPDGRSIPVKVMGGYSTQPSPSYYQQKQAVNIRVSRDLETKVDVEQIDHNTIRILARREVERHAGRVVASEMYDPNSKVSKAVTQSKETRERR